MDPAGNLRNDIEAALLRQNLTAWQRTFLTDIHARLERSGGQARLSDKQWQKIFEILGRPNNVIALPPRPATGNPSRHQPKKSFRPQFGRAGRRLRCVFEIWPLDFWSWRLWPSVSKRSNLGERNFSRLRRH
ncbi:hypothetical protein [Rhizobium leguminosarum]|uniref:hypothetical protein n=1 Tax=Rhizobium leguminosarum TaxID=384 RepID=UPI001FD8BC6E|nr:hypothetical protein [Rhizobium leguminosarum]